MFAEWVRLLRDEPSPQRLSSAATETLSSIAYRQPITRGEIEEVRGVAVATSVMRTLLERGWIKPVGRRDIPGRPITFGTTDAFLNDFGLAHLSDLPTLAHIKSMSELEPGFDFDPEVDADLSFGRMLEAYQTPDRSEQGDDLDDVLAASWQASDALNASFANPLNPLNSTSSDAASPEPEPSPSFHEMAMTESEMNDLIAAKVREQQLYLERQQNQHEKNDNDPEDDASGHR
jgi:segregation and condensation protein B